MRSPIQLKEKNKIEALGINQSIYQAMIRILVANDMFSDDGDSYIMTENNRNNYCHVLENVVYKDPNKQFPQLLEKAKTSSHFFFDTLSASDYEIYSRYNYSMTYEVGKAIVEHLDISGKAVLEIGGNSGGLATVLCENFKATTYTVVDTAIPCRLGDEFKAITKANITFDENDMFDLKLSDAKYDCVVLMNVFHDFGDGDCMKIVENFLPYIKHGAELVIIEDILVDEYEPLSVLMHGLRLAIECRGGKQRTAGEFELLFNRLGYILERQERMNDVHTVLVMKHQQV